jgi:hypothetical protein
VRSPLPTQILTTAWNRARALDEVGGSRPNQGLDELLC